MSYHSNLKHRCTVRRLNEVVVDGSSNYVWRDVKADVRCFIDLSPLTNVNPYYTPEGGRPSQRAGTIFVEPESNGDCPLISGDVVVTTRGPKGTFKIENILDEVWTASKLHHYEIGITEVAPQIARKQVSQDI